VGDVGVVLGGHHDGVDGHRLVVDVLHRELALGVRAQPGQAAVAAHLGLALHDAVGVVDRHRHQLRRLVAGVAEHQALVAGALLEVEALAFVHALGDVGRLAVDGGEHGAGLVVEADVGVVVADALDGVLGDLAVVDVRLGGDLAGDDDEAGGHQRLAGDAGMLVDGQDGVEDGIGNLVGDLVGMAFADRL
jgi:hypothetical protein